MKAKPLIIAGFVAAVVVILVVALTGGSKKKETTSGSGSSSATGSAKPPAGPATEITFVYSTEKEEWLRSAVNEFTRENPDVKVTLVGKGSFESAQAILDGSMKPTLWSPADSLALNLLADDWSTRFHSALFAADGDDKPEPLLLTPLVFVVWEDRAEVLLASAGGTLSWKAIHKAVVSPKGWAAIGGKPDWGFVKLGHTDPTRSNSGLQALLLMTLEHFGKTSGLAVGDLLDDKYQTFVKETERGVTKFEASTGTFMTDMVRFGPSKYDIAVVYESLAVSQLENAQGRWGSLKVYYPATTLWSDHPVALLGGEWVTPAQREAARRLVTHLRSRPMQMRALAFGFRPADPAVPIRTGDGNPFTRLESYGVRIDVPPVAQPPEGPVIRNLMMMWTRVVQSR